MNSSLLDNNNGSDMFSPGHYQRGDSSSPASVSVSPTSTAAKDESCDGAGDDRDGAGTPGSERTECSTPEDARIKRKSNIFTRFFLLVWVAFWCWKPNHTLVR